MLRATKFGSPNLFLKMSFAFAYPSLPPKIAQFLMAALACPDVNCSSLANLILSVKDDLSTNSSNSVKNVWYRSGSPENCSS